MVQNPVSVIFNTFSVGAPAKNLLPVAGLVAYAREPLVFNLFFQLLLTWNFSNEDDWKLPGTFPHALEVSESRNLPRKYRRRQNINYRRRAINTRYLVVGRDKLVA